MSVNSSLKARFLFILYFFPPAPGTAPKRNFRIAKIISEHAPGSIAFTASYPGKEVIDVPEMEIRKMPVFDYRSWLRSKTADGYLPEHRKRQKWKQWGIRFINSFPVNIIAGEGGFIYFINVLSKGNKVIKEKKISHIYSSFRPFTDHFAAYILKKRHPHLFWIADFRDLIIDPHYGHLFFPGSHELFLKKIFSKADLLTTVSDGLALHLKKYNKEVIMLRNGIAHIPEKIPGQHCKYFKICYTGSMFLDTRNPEPVFKALKEMFAKDMIDSDEVRIIYAGKDSFYWNNIAIKYEMDSILSDKGIISHNDAVNIQKNACINLLLTVSSDQLQGVLTGKMIEYFESGSPILGIVANQNDPELNRILHELEIGKSFSDQQSDYEGIKEFVYREYIHWKNTGMNRKPVDLEMLRRKYSVEETMRPLYEKIFGS